MTYRVWLNDDRTLLVRMWESGDVELAIRPDTAVSWGPPILLTEQPSLEPIRERERVGLRLVEGTNP